MPALPISLHEALCSKRARIGLCCAGAGASLLSAFLLRPGASKYFIEAEFPYEEAAIENCLGMPVPGGFVSKNTAMALATRSYMMAAKDHLWWKESNLTTSEMIGIGISAVLASDRMHRGEQRAEVVMIAESACYYFEIRFDKGLGEEDRASQEEQLRCLVLERLEAHLEGGIFGEDCTAELTEQLHQRPLFYASGRRAALPDVGGAYLMPASLNPLHDGHRSMLRLAEHWRAAQREHSQDLEQSAQQDTPCRYLLTTTSPHKGELNHAELLRRLSQILKESSPGSCIEITRGDPLFLDKARARPGATFILGYDALSTMLDPKWGIARDDLLSEFRRLSTHFLVMGRLVGERFTELSEMAIPEEFGSLFTALPGRLDLSSTALRGS